MWSLVVNNGMVISPSLAALGDVFSHNSLAASSQALKKHPRRLVEPAGGITCGVVLGILAAGYSCWWTEYDNESQGLTELRFATVTRCISVLGQPFSAGSPEHPEPVEGGDFARPASFDKLRMLVHIVPQANSPPK
jgi:hypothetical protein